MNRRTFLAGAGAATLAAQSRILAQSSLAPSPLTPPAGSATPADYTLTIEPVSLEISPGVVIKTIAYNGQIPGPLLRLKENVPASIDIVNNSPHEDIVHWHGLRTDVMNDGAMEEGSPMIPSGKTLRYHLKSEPAGTRWYHTHAIAGSDLTRGLYSGQFGFLMVEGKDNPGQFDQEVYLSVRQWEPYFAPMAQVMQEQSSQHPASSGSDVAYKYATINAHRLGAGEPLRVKKGQRVMMHLLNASATDNCILALPGHTFTVLAMDGNPVPNPKAVEIVSLGAAERIDAIVEMNNPGVWVLGSILPKARDMGLGIVVEYAGSAGTPIWKDPSTTVWDYSIFANSKPVAITPDQIFSLTFGNIGPQNGSQFDTWTINRKSWPNTDPLVVENGKRYRMLFHNYTADQHPMHLHRHSFEVASIGNQQMSGLIKDVINVMPLKTVAVDFTADNPGNSLMHCHMQVHMDNGFMTMVKYNS